MKKDYYNVLGVSKSASQDEIKKAYREKAHQYHPDKNSGSDDKFKEINEAYQVLGNPEKRAQYDRFGAAEGGGTAGFDFSSAGGGFDFNGVEFDLGDIFGDFFGGAFGGASRKRNRSQRGRDIGVTLEITLEEAFRGIIRDIELRKLARCMRCKGDGSEPGTGKVTCRACGGIGEINRTQRTFFGMFSHSSVCPDCHGAGQHPESACRECLGEGRVKKIEKLSIPIPSGIESGGILRIRSKGEEGAHGGDPGDLEIKVSVKPHTLFERDGANLKSQISVSFVDAVLGGEVEIKTIDGKVGLKIPAGTQSGSVFKLREKGMPYSASRRGDHLVTVNVRTPKKLSNKAQKVLKDIAEEL